MRKWPFLQTVAVWTGLEPVLQVVDLQVIVPVCVLSVRYFMLCLLRY